MAKLDRNEIFTAANEFLIEEAEEIAKEYAAVLTLRTANRDALYNARSMGHLSVDQLARVSELYPERTRSSADERISKLEEMLEKARIRAEKAAAARTETETDSDTVVADAS